MKTPINNIRFRVWLAGFYLLLVGSVYALPDALTLTVTNAWTLQPVTFNLQRYNLRATNYQVRIYSDATTYTLLPTNQIPEVTTLIDVRQAIGWPFLRSPFLPATELGAYLCDPIALNHLCQSGGAGRGTTCRKKLSRQG